MNTLKQLQLLAKQRPTRILWLGEGLHPPQKLVNRALEVGSERRRHQLLLKLIRLWFNPLQFKEAEKIFGRSVLESLRGDAKIHCFRGCGEIDVSVHGGCTILHMWGPPESLELFWKALEAEVPGFTRKGKWTGVLKMHESR